MALLGLIGGSGGARQSSARLERPAGGLRADGLVGREEMEKNRALEVESGALE
jgi:hypothetical protein